MTPLIPLPPRWTARWFQLAGRTTRKLMGRALAALSAGAIAPSTAHCAAAVAVAAVHTGAFMVTAETGSPMAGTGMFVPSFPDVQSASVMTLSGPGAGSFAAAGWMTAAEPDCASSPLATGDSQARDTMRARSCGEGIVAERTRALLQARRSILRAHCNGPVAYL